MSYILPSLRPHSNLAGHVVPCQMKQLKPSNVDAFPRPTDLAEWQKEGSASGVAWNVCILSTTPLSLVGFIISEPLHCNLFFQSFGKVFLREGSGNMISSPSVFYSWALISQFPRLKSFGVNSLPLLARLPVQKENLQNTRASCPVSRIKL